MSARVARLGASEPAERIAAALHDDGAVIVEGVLSADLLARFNAELDPLLERTSPVRSYLNPALAFFYGNRVRQITGVAAQSRVFGEEILCHPFYTRVCDAVLGPNCASYQLNVAQVMDRGPGAEQQLLHRDEDVWHGRLLLLAGTPIAEPVARYGPFVMNTPQQIQQAIDDYRSGRMGEIVRTARIG